MSRFAHRLTCIVTLLLITAFSLPAASADVRIVAANITSGNFQEYEAEGQRILNALQPDITLMQEFDVGDYDGTGGTNDSADVDAFVADVFGAGYVWYREAGAGIPNGIICAYPILTSGEWADPEVGDRDFAWAQIDIPGDVDLYAVSVHLKAGGTGSDETTRSNQVSAIVNTHVPSLGMPAGSYLVIGGDMNAQDTGDAAITGLSSIVVTSSPYAVGEDGSPNTNAGRTRPYDWVLANSTLDALETTVIYGLFSYANGLVFDTRDFTQTELNNNFPDPDGGNPPSQVQTADSGVTNMQHMAVVRDFAVSTASDDYSIDTTSIAFGTVDAGSGPFTDSTVTVTPVSPSVNLTSVNFTGSHPGEFTLTAPTLPTAISSPADLTFQWTPASNDGASRSVTATITTSGMSPASFDITLTGATQFAGGATLDISGYTLLQTNSAQTFTIPATTILNPGDIVIVGRNETQANFESYWGVTLGANVHHFNSGDTFPLLNGGETYEVRDATNTNVDGPTPAISSDENWQRIATNSSAGSAGSWTVGVDDVGSGATPGTYSGTLAQTGGLVITEFSDADTFAHEFIELIYDANPMPVELSVFMAE